LKTGRILRPEKRRHQVSVESLDARRRREEADAGSSDR
jgi:hypothetical protein